MWALRSAASEHRYRCLDATVAMLTELFPEVDQDDGLHSRRIRKVTFELMNKWQDECFRKSHDHDIH